MFWLFNNSGFDLIPALPKGLQVYIPIEIRCKPRAPLDNNLKTSLNIKDVNSGVDTF